MILRLAVSALTGVVVTHLAGADPLRLAQVDAQQVPVPEQRAINARMEQILESSPSNREVVVRTPKGGIVSITPRAAVSRATGGPCGNCEDQCRPFRYQYQGPGESVFPIVEGLRCRKANGRWLLAQERVVGSLDIRAPTSQPNSPVRTEEQRQELTRQELARQELARQEAARQELQRFESLRAELARQEALREEKARQDAARQETARQDAARQDALRQAESARQEAFRREAALQDAARAEAARQSEGRRQADAKAEAKRQSNETALRAALVRMKYISESANQAAFETGIGAFLSDYRYPLSTSRERILELAQLALPNFELVRPCHEAGSEPACRE